MKKFVITMSLKKSQERQFKIHDGESHNRIFLISKLKMGSVRTATIKLAKGCISRDWVEISRFSNSYLLDNRDSIFWLAKNWLKLLVWTCTLFLIPVCAISVLEIHKPKFFSRNFWVSEEICLKATYNLVISS